MNGWIRRRALSVASGAALAAALTGGSPPAGVGAAATITFGNPTISGVQGTGFEQGLRIDRSGNVYTSAPGSLSSTISYINRSFDRGQTFKWVAGASQPDGKVPTCVGGGDSELATDSSGNLYFADLTLANLSTARSGDRGGHFVFSCAGTPNTPVDRQWLAVDGDPTAGGSISMAYDFSPNLVGLPDPACKYENTLELAKSPVVNPATAGVQYGPNQAVSGPCDEGIMGNNEIHNYGGTKRIFVGHDNNNLDKILMGRCDLVPFTANPLSTGYANCIDVPVATLPNGDITGGNFPTTAIDRAGNILIVWEEAPYDRNTGAVTGDTLLYYSVSTDEGITWSARRQLPTTIGSTVLHNNVMAWPAAGDAGRVDIAWYGTTSTPPSGGTHGPDSVKGDWSLYMEQSLNFASGSPTWSGPVLASEHPIHYGSMYTLIGSQNGDRNVGDFLQLRLGSQGEANISYADTNSDVYFDAQAAFVRQNGGPSVYTSVGTVHLPALRHNSVQVGGHSATFDNAGSSSSNQPNLELLGSRMSVSGSTLQIQMLVADLTSLAAKSDSGGTTLVWDTQWKVPSSTDRPAGGKYFHAYMESVGGAPPSFAVGENATQQEGGGLLATYPGQPGSPSAVTGSYTHTAPGVITINVPLADVTEAGATSDTLYSVTSASMSLVGVADSVNAGGLGGFPFNLIDTTPAYDFNPHTTTPPFNTCHEHDGEGSINGTHGGSASFHSDEDSCDDGAPNSESFNDSGAGESFHSTTVDSIVYDDVLGTAVLAGQGIANGSPVTYTIVETGATALTAARYAITLSDGYVNSGDLVSGNIRLA